MDMKQMMVMGDSKVGKSCLVIQFIQNNFVEDMPPTYFYDTYRKQFLVDGNTANIEICDLGTHMDEDCTEPLFDSDIWLAPMRNVEYGIVVFDITNRSSLDTAQDYLIKWCAIKEKEIPSTVEITSKVITDKPTNEPEGNQPSPPKRSFLKKLFGSSKPKHRRRRDIYFSNTNMDLILFGNKYEHLFQQLKN
eukprot:TRINITY_DN1021_c1_g1_i2.p1 TRINITY_DN1021_c1_g1~~TRINITY_DN1021_c1_g1_i2.p1  ORF type:complete len:192 (-),score=40.30 TRINITY_DN1021_c1_g1_i2:298-873(-)